MGRHKSLGAKSPAGECGVKDQVRRADSLICVEDEWKHRMIHGGSAVGCPVFFVYTLYRLMLRFMLLGEKDPLQMKADLDSMDIVIGIIWERKYCDICGKYTDSRLKTFSMHEGGRFRFTPNEFEERFAKISEIFSENYGGNELMPLMAPLENGELCLALYDESYDLIAYIQFTDEEQYLKETEQDVAAISCVMGFLISEDATSWVDVMIPTLITCDSSLEVSDASDLCESMLLSSATGKPYVHNEIGYAFAPIGDSHMFTISLLMD